MGIFDKHIAKNNGLNLFDDNTTLGALGNAVANTGLNYAKTKIGQKNLPLLNGEVALLNGDFNGAIEAVVNKELIGNLFNRNRSKRRYAQPLLGGLSWKETEDIHQVLMNLKHARKNLFLLQVSDYSPNSLLASVGDVVGRVASDKVSNFFPSQIAPAIGNIASETVKGAINAVGAGFLNEQGGGITSQFNLLSSSVSYTPFSIEAETYNVGSAIIDGAKSSSKAEISITTMDNEQGFVKRWFKEKASEIIHKDGTVGVLSDGLVEIRILHAFISDNTNLGGFEESMICRPVGTEYELDRKDNGVQEFTLRFEQVDTFL